MVGMKYFKTSLALIALTVINHLVVTFAPLSIFWKNVLNYSVFAVCAVSVALMARQLYREEQEGNDEL